jgi:hypothetical protein
MVLTVSMIRECLWSSIHAIGPRYTEGVHEAKVAQASQALHQVRISTCEH